MTLASVSTERLYGPEVGWTTLIGRFFRFLRRGVLLRPLLGAGHRLLVRWRRQGVPDAVVLSRYLVLAGATRFAIEFVRINAPVLGPLTLAQLWSLALMSAGALIAIRAGKIRPEP